MELFDSDKDYLTALQRLNALSGIHARWQATEARKRHTDLFGKTIESGEVYYRKDVFTSAKLSQSSMERLLYSVFKTSPTAEAVADMLLAEEMQSLRAVSERASGALRNDRPAEK